MIGESGCGRQGWMSQGCTSPCIHHRDTEESDFSVSVSVCVIGAYLGSLGGGKVKVKGSGRGRPLYTFFVYPCFFLGRFNRGKPQLLADSRAPKRITASMLERPWGDQ